MMCRPGCFSAAETRLLARTAGVGGGAACVRATEHKTPPLLAGLDAIAAPSDKRGGVWGGRMGSAILRIPVQKSTR